MAKKKSNVEKWLERETPHKRRALENASRHFDEEDKLTVNTLEAIYAQESSFGTQRRKRGITGAAGDFILEKKTAVRMGLTVTKDNDQRFDVDDASAAAAKYLKILDENFGKKTILTMALETIPVTNLNERLKFTIGAFNAGEGRVARAQQKAAEAGKNPQEWDDVKEFLIAAGASLKKYEEIRNYVDNVMTYSDEFAKKSKADGKAKNKEPDKLDEFPKGGHWITKDGRHILIPDKPQ